LFDDKFPEDCQYILSTCWRQAQLASSTAIADAVSSAEAYADSAVGTLSTSIGSVTSTSLAQLSTALKAQSSTVAQQSAAVASQSMSVSSSVAGLTAGKADVGSVTNLQSQVNGKADGSAVTTLQTTLVCALSREVSCSQMMLSSCSHILLPWFERSMNGLIQCLFLKDFSSHCAFY
jgi:hypothetical protein